MTEKPNIQGVNVITKIGEGGQGEVWHVDKQGESWALKLYNPQCGTPEQRAIIERLIDAGPPPSEHKNRFAWPMEIMEAEDGRIGYLMKLIDSEFIRFKDVEANPSIHPGFGVLIEVCRQLAESFRDLNIAGYSFRDISDGNFLFHPQRGDVVICDNDNIVIDQCGPENVLGSPEYMAPEIVLYQAGPSTVTDQHSLAVLFFLLLCGGNPFHGEREFQIRIMDGFATEYLYGHEPVFVFDPVDLSNRPPDQPGYRHVAVYWKLLPRMVQNLFIKGFCQGAKNPSQRITAIEWVEVFTRLEGLRHVCLCGAENFWDPDRQDQQICWNKGCSVNFPPKLYIQGRTISSLLAKPGKKITNIHLGEKSSTAIVGTIEKHPEDENSCLLRNQSSETWNAFLGLQQVTIPPQRAIPLHIGIRINAVGHEITVYP